MISPMKKPSTEPFVSAFSNKLSAMIEASGESTNFWAARFGLHVANFRKLIRGNRPAGPKLAGKIISKVPEEMRLQLMVAYLLDTLVEITLNMGSARQGTVRVKADALLAMVRVALGNRNETDLSEVLGPLEPKMRKLMAMNNPSAITALGAVTDALLSKSKSKPPA